jgi:hypothetical protein
MSITLCPRCHAVRNMVMSTSTRMITGPDGKVKEIRTKLFHCDTCNSFVCSEDIEILEEAGRSNGPGTEIRLRADDGGLTTEDGRKADE